MEDDSAVENDGPDDGSFVPVHYRKFSLPDLNAVTSRPCPSLIPG